MPAFDVGICEMLRRRLHKIQEPSGEAIPFSSTPDRAQLPAEFGQQPIGFCAVSYLRSGRPIIQNIFPSARDWDDMVNRGEKLPESHMGFAHVPIPVEREFCRQQFMDKPEGSGKDQLISRIAISETISAEDGHGLLAGVRSTPWIEWGKRVLCVDHLSGILSAALFQQFTDRSDGFSRRFHSVRVTRA